MFLHGFFICLLNYVTHPNSHQGVALRKLPCLL
nr:MAG TPA: hypothetical protein [Caudoviricetes sp.]